MTRGLARIRVRTAATLVAVAALALPAAAVPVSPIAQKTVAPTVREFSAAVMADPDLCVTLGRVPPSPSAVGNADDQESVLLSNGGQGGFGFELERAPEFDAIE